MTLSEELEYARGIDYDANHKGWVIKAKALEAENKKLKEDNYKLLFLELPELKAELEVLHYFFTWDLDWLKERMAKSTKFDDTNCKIVQMGDGSIRLVDK